MAMTKITGQGLAAMALSVGALWGCFVAERLLVRNAQLDHARVIYQLRELQRSRDAQPVSLPLRHPSRTVKPSAG